MKLAALTVDQDSKVPKYHFDTLNDTLNDTMERRIVERLKQEPATNQKTMAELLDVSVPTVKRIMKKMSDKGIIKRKGGRRFGCWEIQEPGGRQV